MKKVKFKQYRIQTLTGETIVEAADPYVALSKHRKRGVNGLGKGWTLTRQSDGWIVASNRDARTLERQFHKLKEVNWDRTMKSL